MKKGKLKSVLLALGKGAIKEIPIIGGVLANVAEDTADNPRGKLCQTQFIGQVGMVILIILLIKGVIDKDMFGYLINFTK